MPLREAEHDPLLVFIPQCGLAPGFVSIIAFNMAKRFEVLDSVKLRVGALPQYPSNALNYNLTWSTDGVINEYCEPCEAIVNGVRREVPPLEEREEFSLDGVTYEAFNTSGGLGTLCDTLEGKVRNLNYRTIRRTVAAVKRSNDPAFGATGARLDEAITSLERASAWLVRQA